jgi:hypothetical protein
MVEERQEESKYHERHESFALNGNRGDSFDEEFENSNNSDRRLLPRCRRPNPTHLDAHFASK